MRCLSIAFASLMLCSTVMAEQKPSCAVFTFKAGAGLNAGQIGRIGNKYATLLTKTENFHVLPRYQMNRDLMAHRFDYTAYPSELETTIVAGKLLGLDYAILCSFNMKDDQFWFTTSLVDIGTGKVNKTVRSYYRGDVNDFIRLAPASNLANLFDSKPQMKKIAQPKTPDSELAEMEAIERARGRGESAAIQNEKEMQVTAAKLRSEEAARKRAQARAIEQAKRKADEQALALAEANKRADEQAQALAEANIRANKQAQALAEANKRVAKANEEARAILEAQKKAQAEEDARALLEAQAQAEAQTKALANSEAQKNTVAAPQNTNNSTNEWPKHLEDVAFERHKTSKKSEQKKKPVSNKTADDPQWRQPASDESDELSSIPGLTELQSIEASKPQEEAWVKWAEQAEKELGPLVDERSDGRKTTSKPKTTTQPINESTIVIKKDGEIDPAKKTDMLMLEQTQ